MFNKHEAREPDTKPVVWVWFEPGTARFYAGSDRPRQKTRHGRLAQHGLFTLNPLNPFFCTKTCLPALGAKPGSEDRGGRLSLKGTKPARTQYKNGKRTDHNVYINIKSSLKNSIIKQRLFCQTK
jgi:hypothetical protein